MRSDHDGRGTAGKARRRPRARKHTTETHDDRELLIFSIMTLWRSDLPWHTLATDKLELSDWVPNAMVIWNFGDQSVNLAVARAYRFVQDRVFNESPGTPHFESAVLWLKLVTPASIIVISNNLINSRFDYEAQQMWMGIAYGLMESFTRISDVRTSFICSGFLPWVLIPFSIVWVVLEGACAGYSTVPGSRNCVHDPRDRVSHFLDVSKYQCLADCSSLPTFHWRSGALPQRPAQRNGTEGGANKEIPDLRPDR